MIRPSRRAIVAASIWVVLCFAVDMALAQQPSSQDEFTIRANQHDLEIISGLLTGCPASWSSTNPLLAKLQQQISKQQADAQAARDAKIVEDAKKKDDAK